MTKGNCFGHIEKVVAVVSVAVYRTRAPACLEASVKVKPVGVWTAQADSGVDDVNQSARISAFNAGETLRVAVFSYEMARR